MNRSRSAQVWKFEIAASQDIRKTQIIIYELM